MNYYFRYVKLILIEINCIEFYNNELTSLYYMLKFYGIGKVLQTRCLLGFILPLIGLGLWNNNNSIKIIRYFRNLPETNALSQNCEYTTIVSKISN
uniref:Uncharacterized protein n=1 Tax=Heterorhabditis bacteriophora TaxID=37862 RepID=A0A1I7WF05_HETBA